MDFGGYSDPDDIKKIIVDPVSQEVHLILPIFPLGKKAKPPDDFAITNNFPGVYNELQRAIGKADLTLMKTLDNKFAHPRKDGINPLTGKQYTVLDNFKMQSHYSLGKLEYVFPKPDSKNRVIGSYNVTDPTGKKVVLKYKDSYLEGVIPLFTSSQIAREATEDPHNVKKFDLMHTTLTDGPAFGEELSRVEGVCQGDIQSCVFQYGAASDKVADIGMNVHDNMVELYHTEGNCPFCVETELTHLFENNLKNSDYILNSASNHRMPETEKGKESEVLKPDENQGSNNESRAPINTEALAAQVAEKIAKLNKDNEISNTATDSKNESKESEKETGKETSKDIDISNHPAYKKLEALVVDLAGKVESVVGTVKEKDEKLSFLEAKNQEAEIGDILAQYEFNFYDPETQKVDPAKWESAFKFAKDNKLTPKQVKAYLETLSPYGSKPRKMEAMITNKASTNRGVPKYNSAFEGKDPETEESEEGGEKEIHSGGRTVKDVPRYMNLLNTVVRDNNLY
jgi:hypothetical protein